MAGIIFRNKSWWICFIETQFNAKSRPDLKTQVTEL